MTAFLVAAFLEVKKCITGLINVHLLSDNVHNENIALVIDAAH